MVMVDGATALGVEISIVDGRAVVWWNGGVPGIWQTAADGLKSLWWVVWWFEGWSLLDCNEILISTVAPR